MSHTFSLTSMQEKNVKGKKGKDTISSKKSSLFDFLDIRRYLGKVFSHLQLLTIIFDSFKLRIKKTYPALTVSEFKRNQIAANKIFSVSLKNSCLIQSK